MSTNCNVPDRLSFLAEWYDSNADLVKQFHLFYYPIDHTLELFDVKNKRSFLKRTSYPDVGMQQLYLGSTVTIFARPMQLVDYGDVYTRKELENNIDHFVVLANVDFGYQRLGSHLDLLLKQGFQLLSLKTIQVTKTIGSLFSGTLVVALELTLKHGLSTIKEMMYQGENIRDEFKGFTLLYSKDDVQAFYSNTKAPNAKELDSSTLCIIKPHAIYKGKRTTSQKDQGLTGNLIQGVSENFKIHSMMSFHLTLTQAEEFLEIYKGVVPEYPNLIHEFVSGPLIAIQVQSKDNDSEIVSSFRDWVGPIDPELAKKVRPNSLRAKYGENKVKNVFHCTDLPEDGPLEVQYFFELLSQ